MTAKTTEKYSEIAKKYYQDGKLEEALEACKKAIELEQDLETISQIMVALFRDRGDREIDADNFANVGSWLEKDGKYERATNFFRRANRLNSKSYHYTYKLGDLLQKQEQFDEAVEFYLKTIELDPSFLPAHDRLKYAPLNSQQLEKAIETYYEVVESYPDLPLLHVSLGNLLTRQGLTEQAIQSYQNAIYKQTLGSNPDYVKQYWDETVRPKPDFLIVGVGKCGTSSLYVYLNEHPQILRPVEKEIHFLNHQNHWNQGEDWYRSHFPPIPEGCHFLTGEATPWYITTFNAERKVFELFPEVKPIVLLRNPVDRAISHYHMHVADGRDRRSLEEAMTAEMEILQGLEDPTQVGKTNYWQTQQGYLLLGLYFYFLKKWVQVFSKQQLLILKSEDLYQQPAEIMKQVYDFLELPNHTLKQYKKFKSGSYSPTRSAIKQKLYEFFQPYNQKLEEYLDRSFDWE